MTKSELDKLGQGLFSLTAFESWDERTQETVKMWLGLQGIGYLLPDTLRPDNSLQLAIKVDGQVYHVKIG